MRKFISNSLKYDTLSSSITFSAIIVDTGLHINTALQVKCSFRAWHTQLGTEFWKPLTLRFTSVSGEKNIFAETCWVDVQQ